MLANKNVFTRGRFSAWFGVLTALVCAGMMVVLPGCDPCIGVDVDDADPCTVDYCEVDEETGEPVVFNDPLCLEDEVCIVEDGEGVCVECAANADCGALQACVDNVCEDVECLEDEDCGTFCAPATCDTDGYECVAGTAPDCPFGCNIERDECNACTIDGDCEDGLFCTGDPVCTNGLCSFTGDPCDVGEVCIEDADTCGECATDADCADDDVCNTVGYVCEPEAGPCTVDADCDDGLFCNGLEICSNSLCQDGALPCDPDSETCEEGDTAAVCVPIPGETIEFTLEQDDKLGTTANDTFNAPLEFNEGTGTQLATFQNGDAADGLAGTDTLNITLGGTLTADNTITATLSGIEVINITDFSGDTAGPWNQILAGANITGLLTLKSTASSGTAAAADAITVNNLATLCDLGLYNTFQALTVAFTSSASTASDDTMTLTLSNTNNGVDPNNGPVITITEGGANGIETLSIVSTGSGANTVDDIVLAQATLTTVNISGDQDLGIDDALDNNVTTVNASTFTGNLTELIVGNGVVAFTGGGGDDFVNYGVNYTTADVINGGTGGTDTLGIGEDEVAVTVAQSNVTNIDALRVTEAINGANVSAKWFGTVTEVTLDDGFDSAHTLTLLQGTNTVNMGAFAAGNTSGGAGTLTTSGSATTDVLNLNVNDFSDGNGLTVSNTETINLASNLDLDGSAAVGGVNTWTTLTMSDTAAEEVLNITGTESLTFTGAIQADVINAGTFAHPFIMGAATTPAAASKTITGGTGADTLYGSTGADSILGGDGNDTLEGLDGADLLTGGAGNDGVLLRDDDSTDTFTDFAVGGTADFVTLDASDYSAELVAGQLVDEAGAAATPDAGNATILSAANGAATAATGNGETLFKITTTTGINSSADLSGSFTLTANAGNAASAIVLLWYDADDARAVVSLVNDTGAAVDANINIDNDAAATTVTDILYIPMTTTDFGNFNEANLRYQA